MALAAGGRIGPYEIRALIGEGGMGEVYRAHDPRLGRDVAIKVVPAAFSGDPDRLRRFEQEARAAAALSHPNIVAIFDVVTGGDHPCVVTELLEGRTVRDALSASAISPRKAIEYGIQIGQGLAAAHEKGIVHRDLKPENLFVTSEGRVKILDFGLAKLTEVAVAGAGATMVATRTIDTSPGVAIGTVGYMSPEQVRGQAVDHRTDIFSFGAVLYEMLSGTRAFRGDSTADTMSAILKEDPPELASESRPVPASVERVVRRCLEKNPAERFQSAKDLTFALDALSHAGSRSSQMAAAIGPRRPGRTSRLVAAGLGTIGIVAIIAAAYVIGARRSPAQAQPVFQQLTYRRGTVRAARFAPDGQTVVYSAAWEGRPIELFSTRPGSAESRSLEVPASNILAISPSGEMAIALDSRSLGPWNVVGTLARAQLAGGAPRSLLESITSADWSPDGQRLAVLRRQPIGMRIEYPIGNVLFDVPVAASNLRVSPDGRTVAFLDHPFGDEGSVDVIDTATKQHRVVSSGWASIEGLAWSRDGREVWFTATKSGMLRAIWAVSLAGGPERLVLRIPRRATLQDLAADGRALVTTETLRSEVLVGAIGGGPARSLSWFDWATALSLSRDGRLLNFTESGEGAGEHYGIYIRSTDGSPAVRLADGNGSAVSPDGKWAIMLTSAYEPRLVPTGAGEPRSVGAPAFEGVAMPSWMADSNRFLMVAREKGHRARVYVGSVSNPTVNAITPEGIAGRLASPDGQWLFVRVSGGEAELYSLTGGEPRPLAAIAADEGAVAWTPDSRGLIVRERGSLARLARYDLQLGKRTPFAELYPPDVGGVIAVGEVVLTADLKQYAYNYFRNLGELIVVSGLK